MSSKSKVSPKKVTKSLSNTTNYTAPLALPTHHVSRLLEKIELTRKAVLKKDERDTTSRESINSIVSNESTTILPPIATGRTILLNFEGSEDKAPSMEYLSIEDEESIEKQLLNSSVPDIIITVESAKIKECQRAIYDLWYVLLAILMFPRRFLHRQTSTKLPESPILRILFTAKSTQTSLYNIQSVIACLKIATVLYPSSTDKINKKQRGGIGYSANPLVQILLYLTSSATVAQPLSNVSFLAKKKCNQLLLKWLGALLSDGSTELGSLLNEDLALDVITLITRTSKYDSKGSLPIQARLNSCVLAIPPFLKTLLEAQKTADSNKEWERVLLVYNYIRIICKSDRNQTQLVQYVLLFLYILEMESSN
jgi:hypothetical protein